MQGREFIFLPFFSLQLRIILIIKEGKMLETSLTFVFNSYLQT